MKDDKKRGSGRKEENFYLHYFSGLIEEKKDVKNNRSIFK